MDKFDELLEAWERESERENLKRHLDALVPLRSLQSRILRSRRTIVRFDYGLVIFYSLCALYYVCGVIIGWVGIWGLINVAIWSAGALVFSLLAKKNRKMLTEAQEAFDKTDASIKTMAERYERLK